jgi:heat shock protein HslJ
MAAAAILLAATAPAATAQGEFPFDHEMLLDERPLPGSKRVPILDIGADGRATVDLWCKSGPAQVEVSGSAIKFTLAPMPDAPCTPERMQRDDDMAAALAEVTNWRIEGDVVTLIGPTPLRFRLSTH